MDLRPVKRYPRPDLPTRDTVDARPELLRLLPKRWQGNAAVVAALTTCLAMTGGLRSDAAERGEPSRVAPIFRHGSGRTSFGGIGQDPAVFLSEEEARAVIVDEARKAGLSFEPDGRVLPAVETPVTAKWKPPAAANIGRAEKTRVRTVTLDGVDRKHNVAFEYVSQADFADWETSYTRPSVVEVKDPQSPRGTITVRAEGTSSYFSTVSDFDMLGAAERLRHGIALTKPSGVYGVLYDPCVSVAEAAKRSGHKVDYGTTPAERQAERAKVTAMVKVLDREQLRA